MKIGELVQLKSGGPTMTIRNIIDNDVICVYFKNDELIEVKFNVDMLTIINDDLNKYFYLPPFPSLPPSHIPPVNDWTWPDCDWNKITC